MMTMTTTALKIINLGIVYRNLIAAMTTAIITTKTEINLRNIISTRYHTL